MYMANNKLLALKNLIILSFPKDNSGMNTL